MSGPCAKMRVTMVLFGRDEEVVSGNNDCEFPQEVCPREPGEGYEKCKSVCGQYGHAEEMALRTARKEGMRLDVARGNLYGQDHMCDRCFAQVKAAGIKYVTIYGKGSVEPTRPVKAASPP